MLLLGGFILPKGTLAGVQGGPPLSLYLLVSEQQNAVGEVFVSLVVFGLGK